MRSVRTRSACARPARAGAASRQRSNPHPGDRQERAQPLHAVGAVVVDELEAAHQLVSPAKILGCPAQDLPFQFELPHPGPELPVLLVQRAGPRSPGHRGLLGLAYRHAQSLALQLEAAARDLLTALAVRTPLLPGASTQAYVDVDSLLRRVYGHAK